MHSMDSSLNSYFGCSSDKIQSFVTFIFAKILPEPAHIHTYLLHCTNYEKLEMKETWRPLPYPKARPAGSKLFLTDVCLTCFYKPTTELLSLPLRYVLLYHLCLTKPLHAAVQTLSCAHGYGPQSPDIPLLSYFWNFGNGLWSVPCSP